MDIKLFTQILNDKHFSDYKKMKYKFGDDFTDFLKTIEELYYKELPLDDFVGSKIVFMDTHAAISQKSFKLLIQPQNDVYGINAAENEIVATSAIESIDFNRDSVQRILKGK